MPLLFLALHCIALVAVVFLFLVFCVPSFFKTHLFVKSFKIVLYSGNIRQLIKFLIFANLAFVNRFLMMIEDWIFPSLARIENDFFNTPNKIVVITGHQRSGTTNVHKAVSSLDDCITGTMTDLLLPSLLLKYLMSSCKSIINTIFFRQVVSQDDIKGHKVGVDEELEEQHLMLHYQGAHSFSVILCPVLGDQLEFLTENMDVKDYHLAFTRRCIARIIAFHNAADKRYVACGLGFATKPELMRKYFPKATFVACVRDPVQTMPSFIDMLETFGRTDFDQAFSKRMQSLYRVYSSELYKALAKFDDEQTHWLDFNKWKDNGVEELEKIWQLVGWNAPPGASQAALLRSEKHTNRPEAFEIIPADEINRDLNQYYKAMLAKCS